MFIFFVKKFADLLFYNKINLRNSNICEKEINAEIWRTYNKIQKL